MLVIWEQKLLDFLLQEKIAKFNQAICCTLIIVVSNKLNNLMLVLGPHAFFFHFYFYNYNFESYLTTEILYFMHYLAICCHRQLCSE